VVDAVCIILGQKPNWSTFRDLLAKENFVDILMNCELHLPSKLVADEVKLLTVHEEFTVDHVRVRRCYPLADLRFYLLIHVRHT